MTGSHPGRKGVEGRQLRYFKEREERVYLKIEILEGLENANSSLSLADMWGMFKTGATNVMEGKIKMHDVSNCQVHALR